MKAQYHVRCYGPPIKLATISHEKMSKDTVLTSSTKYRIVKVPITTPCCRIRIVPFFFTIIPTFRSLGREKRELRIQRTKQTKNLLRNIPIMGGSRAVAFSENLFSLPDHAKLCR